MRNKWIKVVFPLLAALLLVAWFGVFAGDNDTMVGQEVLQTEVTQTLVPPSQSFYEPAEGTKPSSQEQAHHVSDASNQLPDSEPVSITPSIIPNDSYFDKQWALAKIQALEAWPVTSSSQDVLIAILDTGIDPNHEDLEDKVVAEVNFTDSSTTDDIHGHGTHIAGIIAANSNNGIGIAGVAPDAQLMNVKDISIEIREASPELEDAVNYAWSQGVIIITAAGNDGSQSPIYPAYYENSIAVERLRRS